MDEMKKEDKEMEEVEHIVGEGKETTGWWPL